MCFRSLLSPGLSCSAPRREGGWDQALSLSNCVSRLITQEDREGETAGQLVSSL